MVSKASVQYVRIAPRKVRYVLDLIRHKSVPQAESLLNGSAMRATGMIQKLLHQAVDAAKRNSHIEAKDLIVSKVLADCGPSMKRFRAGSMGRGMTYVRRSSHIQLELDARKGYVAHDKKAAPAKTVAKSVKAQTSGKGEHGAAKKMPAKKMAGAK